MRAQIEAVQRMQDYIMEHLGDGITLGDLAKAACFPPGIPTGYLSSGLVLPRQGI